MENPFMKKFKPIIDKTDRVEETSVEENNNETEEKVEDTMNEKDFNTELEEINMDITSEDNSKNEDLDFGLDSPEESSINNQDLQETELDPDNDPALLAVKDLPEDDKPAEEVPKKKRHRRTKKEMEAARAAEAAEKAAKLAAKGEEPPESDSPVEEIKQEETVEEVKEEVPEVKTKRTRTKKEKTEYEDPSDCKEFYCSSINIEEVSEDILNNFEAEKFKKFKEEFTAKVNNIEITSDMNIGAIKYALKDINDLRSQLYIPMVKTRQIINSITHKDYGIITAFMAEHAVGDNATDRKATSFKSLRNFNVDGRKIDFVEVLTGLQFRSEYFESMNKLLDRKQDMLLSYIALLKIEAKFDA